MTDRDNGLISQCPYDVFTCTRYWEDKTGRKRTKTKAQKAPNSRLGALHLALPSCSPTSGRIVCEGDRGKRKCGHSFQVTTGRELNVPKCPQRKQMLDSWNAGMTQLRWGNWPGGWDYITVCYKFVQRPIRRLLYMCLSSALCLLWYETVRPPGLVIRLMSAA